MKTLMLILCLSMALVSAAQRPWDIRSEYQLEEQKASLQQQIAENAGDTHFMDMAFKMMDMYEYKDNSAVLSKQYDESPTAGLVSSENGSLMDAVCADDFSVPAGLEWEISQLFVPGFVSGGDDMNPDSYRVDIYEHSSSDNMPGSLVHTQTTTDFIFNNGDALLELDDITLGEGVYWLSVVGINMDNSNFRWNWVMYGTDNGRNSAFKSKYDSYNLGGEWVTLPTAVQSWSDVSYAMFGNQQVPGVPTAVKPVPTLGQWGTILVSLSLITIGIVVLRQQELEVC